MKENEIKMSFWHKVALLWLYGFHVLGATTLIITVLALCGVHIYWWIGALCTIPGYLIIEGLVEYLWRQSQKRKRAFKKAEKEMCDIIYKYLKEHQDEKAEILDASSSAGVENLKKAVETFGKKTPVKQPKTDLKFEIPEAKVECRFSENGTCTYGDSVGMNCEKLKEVRVQSVEDPHTVYLQEGDIRRILHEGKEVGWYRWE